MKVAFSAVVLMLLIATIHTSGMDNAPRESTNLCIVAEYYFPKSEDREIQSVFTAAMFGKEYLNRLHYSLYGGLIATYAWGDIVQELVYTTRAFGIGPAGMIRVDFLRWRGFHLSGDFLLGIILYSTHFPPGGDVYNFFRKYGLAVGLAFDETHEVVLGARDMHVSNGQGLNAHNPSYEGFGISADFVIHL